MDNITPTKLFAIVCKDNYDVLGKSNRINNFYSRRMSFKEYEKQYKDYSQRLSRAFQIELPYLNRRDCTRKMKEKWCRQFDRNINTICGAIEHWAKQMEDVVNTEFRIDYFMDWKYYHDHNKRDLEKYNCKVPIVMICVLALKQIE